MLVSGRKNLDPSKVVVKKKNCYTGSNPSIGGSLGILMGEGIQNVCDLFSSSFPWGSNFDVADLSPIHFRKEAAIDGTYVSKYW